MVPNRVEPLRTTDGSLRYWIGVNFDIEERKEAELYLAEGERLAHMGSWSFTPSGRCDYWSLELYEIAGFDPAKGIPIISEFLTDVHPDDRERITKTIDQMMAERQALTLSIGSRTRNAEFGSCMAWASRCTRRG